MSSSENSALTRMAVDVFPSQDVSTSLAEQHN